MEIRFYLPFLFCVYTTFCCYFASLLFPYAFFTVIEHFFLCLKPWGKSIVCTNTDYSILSDIATLFACSFFGTRIVAHSRSLWKGIEAIIYYYLLLFPNFVKNQYFVLVYPHVTSSPSIFLSHLCITLSYHTLLFCSVLLYWLSVFYAFYSCFVFLLLLLLWFRFVFLSFCKFVPSVLRQNTRTIICA